MIAKQHPLSNCMEMAYPVQMRGKIGMRHVFTRESGNGTSDAHAPITPTGCVNRGQMSMMEADVPKVGMVYRSRRTNRMLTVIAIESDRVYYQVDGFATMSPLFLPMEKFMHLVGLDKTTQ